MQNFNFDHTGSKKMLLWNPKDLFIDHKLDEGDDKMISEEFYKKYLSLKNKTKYVPNPIRDSLMRKYFKTENFDFYEFSNRFDCISSLKCENLRKQKIYFSNFSKIEYEYLKKLKILYDFESDENMKMCLKEIIKTKTLNLKYIESIQDHISKLICLSQEAADHFGDMYKIVREKN